MKPGVLFMNFGGPTGPDELVPFLRNLLGDVLPGPRWFKRLAAGRLAPLRASRVLPRYEGIGWSPVTATTREQLAGVAQRLGDAAPPMEAGMMFTPPSIATALSALVDAGCDHVVAVGLFPHWSFATTGAATDMLAEAAASLGARAPRLHVARAFFDDPAYLRAVAATVRRAAEALPGEGPIHLLFSAHGVPASFLRRGDPYADHVQATVRGVVRELGWTDPYALAWQSRLGPVRWLGPSTPEVVARLGASGVRRVLVVPVSFVGEHIETLDELDKELAEDAHRAGITAFGRAAALGMEPLFLDALTDLVRASLAAFDRARCVRCLLPVPADHHRARCLDCGFTSTPGLKALATVGPR